MSYSSQKLLSLATKFELFSRAISLKDVLNKTDPWNLQGAFDQHAKPWVDSHIKLFQKFVPYAVEQLNEGLITVPQLLECLINSTSYGNKTIKDALTTSFENHQRPWMMANINKFEDHLPDFICNDYKKRKITSTKLMSAYWQKMDPVMSDAEEFFGEKDKYDLNNPKIPSYKDEYHGK